MSATRGGDVRGFYAALGVALPERAALEAPVSCFAAPEAHAHRDRDASCSVNLLNGLWHCHGCGAGGGPYDAATARGRSAREAMDLLVCFGLAERRAGGSDTSPRRSAGRGDAAVLAPERAGARVVLDVEEDDVQRWGSQLAGLRWPPRVLRAAQARVWSREVLLALGCGWERGRITIPIRNRAGALRGVLRYAPSHDRTPKMLALAGTRLGLVPHPAMIPDGWVLLVEGPPDMITARSRGLPAVAVPGDHAWEPAWAGLLAGRRVAVAMDCDRAGRVAAARIAGDLQAAGAVARRVDLDSGRDDGWDLTDWLAERHRENPAGLRAALRSLVINEPASERAVS